MNACGCARMRMNEKRVGLRRGMCEEGEVCIGRRAQCNPFLAGQKGESERRVATSQFVWGLALKCTLRVRGTSGTLDGKKRRKRQALQYVIALALMNHWPSRLALSTVYGRAFFGNSATGAAGSLLFDKSIQGNAGSPRVAGSLAHTMIAVSGFARSPLNLSLEIDHAPAHSADSYLACHGVSA